MAYVKGNWTALVIGMGALFWLGCSSGPPTTTFTIGGVIDQTSTTAWTSWATVGQMAIDQLNQAAGNAGSGVRFKLIIEDPQQNAVVAVQRAQDLVTNYAAKAIISDTSANDTAIVKTAYDADNANDLKVPITCVTCTSPALMNPAATDADPIQQATLQDAMHWNFRTVHRATEQNAVLHGVIAARGTQGDVNGDGKLKLAVAVLNDTSGSGFANSVAKLFAGTPNLVVEKVIIDGANHDVNDTAFFADVAQKLIDDGSDCPFDPANVTGCGAATTGDGFPDALMENLNPGYNIAVARALADAGNTVSFFHAHAFRATQIATTLQDAINGQLGVSGVLADTSPSGEQYKKDVMAKTGAGPTLLDDSMYDAVVLNALAMFKSTVGTAAATMVKGADVRDNLQKLNDPTGQVVRVGVDELTKTFKLIQAGTAINYEGASGPVDFDASGNVTMRLSLYEGVNGHFVDKEIHDCVADSATCPNQ
jgi:ABC-type branched-subunit amino acid transport system substrate-binding protein